MTGGASAAFARRALLLLLLRSNAVSRPPAVTLMQGISAIENMLGRPHVLNHLSVPAACFTHPEVSFVGVTQVRQWPRVCVCVCVVGGGLS